MITIKEVDRRIAERLMELGFNPEWAYPVNYLKLDKDKTLVELKQVKRYLQTNPSEEVVKKQYKQSKKHNTPTDANNVLAGRCFLAMFENGNKPFYLANWEGDPGRTLLKENAKQFRTKALAEKAIKKAEQKYPQRNLVGKVIEYNAR